MIGIFDSGVGGLSALRAARELLPTRNFLYFGDTAHVPYGNRSPDAILRHTRTSLRFLCEAGVEAILVACGTASATALPRLRGEFSIPIFGIIEPTVEAALSATKNYRIAIAATKRTVESGAFSSALLCREARVRARGFPCPLFVPLVENGVLDKDDPLLHLAICRHLSPLRTFGADVLILGCTHFPLLADAIGEIYRGVALIDSGRAAATQLLSLPPRVERGECRFCVSDDPHSFENTAELLLGHAIRAERVKPHCSEF
ncbi:MAG: glutamate racemase [Clostridia bacterium]|nr:glutamate racemase [Clostridia bacterium]